MVDGYHSKLVDLSGVLEGSVLGPLLFLLFTLELFSFLENNLIGYADELTLMGIAPSQGLESLIHDLGMVCEWCDLWGMKLNVSKTKTVVSRSCTMHPQSPPLLKKPDNLVTLWVTFDSKMTFEQHLLMVSRAASLRLGILRKSWQVFHDRVTCPMLNPFAKSIPFSDYLNFGALFDFFLWSIC